ncbi:MAG: TonB-dependent receptor [Bacteroidia bacterium]|nr:TonB-dependent receptor [Bacteroidia bacterium]
MRGIVVGISLIWAQQIGGYLKEGGKPIGNVKVWWSGTSISTLTDSEGYFRIAPPPAWPAILLSERSGDSLVVPYFPEREIEWEIAPSVEIPVQPIQDVGPQRKLSGLPVQVLDRKVITAAPCCNLSQAFESTALVDMTFPDGNLGIRQLRRLGFEPAHSPIWYEGKPLSTGLYRPWSAHFLPALWIQSLSLTKGIGSVLHGFDGAAGQIQATYLNEEDMQSKEQVIEGIARTTGEFFLSGRWQSPAKKGIFLGLGSVGWTPFRSAFLQDHNRDRFLDIPLFRQGHALMKRLWRDSIGNLIELEVEGLTDVRWGGQIEFRSPSQIASLEAWGVYQVLHFAQLSLRRGWVFSQGRGLSLLGQGRWFQSALQAGFNHYAAQQPLGWMQLIYREPIGDTRWLLYVGMSYQGAHYAESLHTWHGYDTVWRRPEHIPGIFSEISLTPLSQLSLVLGGRADWHSYWGWQFVPRVHLRWQYNPTGILRLSSGRSWRVPDPMTESLSFLMSNRQWRIAFPGWPAVESAWTHGFFWQHTFMIGDALVRFSLDGVQARIKQPFLWDIQRFWEIRLFSGSQPTYYQTLYAEVAVEWIDRLRLQLTYKHQEVWQPLLEGKYLFRFLLPRQRVVFWLSWMTLSRRWQVDGIISWVGPQQLPSLEGSPLPYRIPSKTPSYALLTLQLTHRIDEWEIQLGGENLTGFRQSWPVIAPEAPFSPYMDASLVWGPIMGQCITLTLRYRW